MPKFLIFYISGSNDGNYDVDVDDGM